MDHEKEALEMETNEAPVEVGAPGALVGDLDQNNQATAPRPVNDSGLEREFGNSCHVFDENWDASPANHAQDSPSETIDVHRKAVKQMGLLKVPRACPPYSKQLTG